MKSSQPQTKFTGSYKKECMNIRSSHRRCSVEKGVLRNFAKFTGKRLCQSLFLIKLQALGLQPYKKRRSGTGVFLWILQNLQEHFFLQNTSGGCFWIKCFDEVLLLGNLIMLYCGKCHNLKQEQVDITRCSF